MDKSSRLSSPQDFKQVYQRGRKVSTGDVRLYVLERPGEHTRVGFSVKRCPKAVERNRIKRQLREAYRLQLDAPRYGFDLVVVAQESLRGKTFWQIEKALRHALTKGRLLNRNEKNTSFADQKL